MNRRSLVTFAAACASLALSGSAFAFPMSNVWINEIHYDNSGTDTGEFVEVVIGPGGPAASDVTLWLYNGSTGAPYGTQHNVGSAFTLGALVSGYQFYYLTLPTDGLQNGAPDGLALEIDPGDTLDDFISYEGSFVGTGTGPAVGASSANIGLSESSSTAVGSSLGLTGTGLLQEDFTWSVLANTGPGTGVTPGDINYGQSFGEVPAPGALALLGLAGVIGRRRRTA